MCGAVVLFKLDIIKLKGNIFSRNLERDHGNDKGIYLPSRVDDFIPPPQYCLCEQSCASTHQAAADIFGTI
jgi:hypothetical protein